MLTKLPCLAKGSAKRTSEERNGERKRPPVRLRVEAFNLGKSELTVDAYCLLKAGVRLQLTSALRTSCLASHVQVIKS